LASQFTAQYQTLFGETAIAVCKFDISCFAADADRWISAVAHHQATRDWGRPDTEAQDQSSPDHQIQLTFGSGLQRGHPYLGRLSYVGHNRIGTSQLHPSTGRGQMLHWVLVANTYADAAEPVQIDV
jgi:hypothetical protein